MIGGRGDTQIDMYSLGISVTPYTVYDYYSMQNMAKEAGNMGQKDDVQPQAQEADAASAADIDVDSLTANVEDEEEAEAEGEEQTQ